MHFIRLGVGVSVGTLVGALPAFAATPVDGLEAWAMRHKARVMIQNGTKHLVARTSGKEVGAVLQELHGVADGPLLCQGNEVSGSFAGSAFVVKLEWVS